jgi:hypothetical protein
LTLSSTGADDCTGLLESAIGCQIPTQACGKARQNRKARVPKVETILAALKSHRDARISLMDLIIVILSGEYSELSSYRRMFLDSTRITDVLDFLWNAEKSKATLKTWIENTGVVHICKVVGEEMESAKPLLRMNLKDVSPAYLEGWDINTIMEPVAIVTLTWSKILCAATDPHKRNHENNRETRNRSTVFSFS